MSPAPDRLGQTLEWMDRGTAFFVGQLGALSDPQLAEPSGLPEWTRLHVVSHMARNARALMNLLRWAMHSPRHCSGTVSNYDSESARRRPCETGTITS